MLRRLFFLSVIFCACSGAPSIPSGVLPQEKMEAVLYDVIRADEMVEFLKMSDSTYQRFSKRTALYDSVFQLHNIKKETFQTSLHYYQSRPDLLREIFDDLRKKAADTSRHSVDPSLK